MGTTFDAAVFRFSNGWVDPQGYHGLPRTAFVIWATRAINHPPKRFILGADKRNVWKGNVAEIDPHYADEPVRRLQRAVDMSRRVEAALARLLTIYEKKVAVLERMKFSGHLNDAQGEWSLMHAKTTLHDIHEAIGEARIPSLQVRVYDVLEGG